MSGTDRADHTGHEERTDAAAVSPGDVAEDGPGRDARNPWRGVVALAEKLLLALALLVTSAVVALSGVYLALECVPCEYGVRQARFETPMLVLAEFVVPVTALGTTCGMFLARRWVRVCAAGLGVQMAVLCLLLLLGRFPG